MPNHSNPLTMNLDNVEFRRFNVVHICASTECTYRTQCRFDLSYNIALTCSQCATFWSMLSRSLGLLWVTVASDVWLHGFVVRHSIWYLISESSNGGCVHQFAVCALSRLISICACWCCKVDFDIDIHRPSLFLSTKCRPHQRFKVLSLGVFLCWLRQPILLSELPNHSNPLTMSLDNVEFIRFSVLQVLKKIRWNTSRTFQNKPTPIYLTDAPPPDHPCRPPPFSVFPR